MDIATSFAIVAFAALIHASFQLSVGVLSLLSGHALSAQKSNGRILHLTTSYTIGAGVMTLLLISFISLVLLHIFGPTPPLLMWAMACGLVLGIGVAVWLFYYRRGTKGSELWIPRAFAQHLHNRSKATRSGVESFSLGLTSVFAELIFIVPSMTISALVLLELSGPWQLAGLALYTIVSMLGLLITWSMIGSGRSLARIEQWRARNKRFLQFAAGSALIVLGFYVYVSKVIATLTGAM